MGRIKEGMSKLATKGVRANLIIIQCAQKDLAVKQASAVPAVPSTDVFPKNLLQTYQWRKGQYSIANYKCKGSKHLKCVWLDSAVRNCWMK